MARLVRLIAVLAVLLMPLGMQQAAAAPSETHHASMPMQHCPEQGSKHEKGAFVECTMACSAALPALDQPQQASIPIACERVRPSLARHLSDLHPEIATPPPKVS